MELLMKRMLMWTIQLQDSQINSSVDATDLSLLEIGKQDKRNANGLASNGQPSLK